MVRPHRVSVTPQDIRERFDLGGYADRAIQAGYTCCVKKVVACRAATEPNGTSSVTLEFHDRAGIFVFMVHVYLRPDGQLGASGKLDPKCLVDDYGTEYFV